MIRNLLGLLIVAGLCTLAGAQGTQQGLTASQQQKLFHKNRSMIRTLVDSSLEISGKSGDFLQRSRAYRRVMLEMQKELSNAADEEDASRVAELGQHLNTVIRQGLTPSLKAATRQIGPEGSNRQDLVDLRDRSVEMVNWLQEKARTKWSDTPQVREVVDSLEKTKKDLRSSISP